MPTQPERDWLDRARIDLDSAEILAAHAGHADTICFLCQQAVEKVLKARLVARGSAPPRIHDLIALRRPLPDVDIGASEEDLAFLSSCYIASRYPTLDPELRTSHEVERSLRIARDVIASAAVRQT